MVLRNCGLIKDVFRLFYRLLLSWGSQGSGKGQFKVPWGVAVNSSAGSVYVTDVDNFRVQKFDESGNFILAWGSQGSGNGQFLEPYCVAVDSSWNVYVVDQGNNRVDKFSELRIVRIPFPWIPFSV